MKQLFPILMTLFFSHVGFSQDTINIYDEDPTAARKAVQMATCIQLDSGKKSVIPGSHCNVNPHYVLEEDYATIKAENLKPICPEKVKLAKNPEPPSPTSTIATQYPELLDRPVNLRVRKLLVIDEDPYALYHKAPCYFQTKNGRKIHVKNYYLKCTFTGLKEKGMDVTKMWRAYDINFEKLSECYNSEEKQMAYEDIFQPRVLPTKASSPKAGGGGR